MEDVEEGTFTNLYEGDFVYTPTSDLEGAGRFFIHMTADTPGMMSQRGPAGKKGNVSASRTRRGRLRDQRP